MSKFIPVNDFAELYDASIKTIDVRKCKGLLPCSVFRVGAKKGQRLIDVEFFTRRREFKEKVWLESHEMYYFLTKHCSSKYLAFLLSKIDNSVTVGTWTVFLHSTLFRLFRDDILTYSVGGLAMKFYRYARWLIRALFIKLNVPSHKRDLAIILNRD